MSDSPALPEAAHANLDSMLSRRFGKEVGNYFSGSPLNRVSFLRGEHGFLSSAFKHPSTSFLLFNDLKPLTSSPSKLEYVSLSDIQGLTGENPYAKSEEDMIKEYDSSVSTPQMIFLGLNEQNQSGFAFKEYKGAPFFAVDVSSEGSRAEEANKIISAVKGKGWDFLGGRMIMSLPATEAAIYAQARALLDWNARNPFCAGCGQPTLSVNGGGKRTCPPSDMASLKGAIGATTDEKPIKSAERPSCKTRQGISNLCFPRTDPTVIMAVISSDGQKILLGRSKRFPPDFYSTLAGFCEPAESIEEAVRREVWEEAGVKLGRVVIHSTQPWPYPANLMIGAIAQAIPEGEKIDLGNDPELEDAQWFSMEEIREAMRIGTGPLDEKPGPDYKGGIRLPPPTAIAHQLIASLASGFLGGNNKI